MNITLQNRSGSEIVLNGHRINPHRSLTISYQGFIDMVIAEDLTKRNDIVVIKERDVPSEVSVSEFGARGNGTDEDTYAMQKAVDFLTLNGGGVMHVAAGIYPIKGLSITSPIQVNGAGSKNTIIKMIGDGVLFDFEDCGDSAISNIKVRKVSNGAAVGSTGTAFKVSSSDSTEQQLSLFNVVCESGQFAQTLDIGTTSHIVGGFTNEK